MINTLACIILPHRPSESRWTGQSHGSQGWTSQLGRAVRIQIGQEEELQSGLPAHMPSADEQMP